MKIYTKKGDSGSTSLLGGKKVDKDDLRIEAYGNIDELNSVLGMVASGLEQNSIVKKILRIQGELMVVGSNLALPPEVNIKLPKINNTHISRLEREIDAWQTQLPLLKNFILPGGSVASSRMHFARSVARRSERFISRLSKTGFVDPKITTYVNRLSDWLFVLARILNKLDNQKEIIWRGRKSRS